MDVMVSVGLIFDESVDPDRTLEPEHFKPKVTLIQDPKQSQVQAGKLPLIWTPEEQDSSKMRPPL